MTNYRSIILLLVISSVFMFGCEPELQEKYQRPDWLKGKIYSQLTEIPEVSIFTSAVELIGYDTIIDVSGTYTVLAPTDEAFAKLPACVLGGTMISGTLVARSHPVHLPQCCFSPRCQP